MKTNNVYRNAKAMQESLRVFISHFGRIIPFLFALIVCSFLGVLAPQAYSQNYVKEFQFIKKQAQSQIKTKNYLKLSPKTTLTIKGSLVVKTNLYLESSISGDGDLLLSSEKRIDLYANNKNINTLIIEPQTKVRLKGHLHIERELRIQDEGEIALSNFSLVLSSHANLDDNTKKYLQNAGIGRLIHAGSNKNLIDRHLQNKLQISCFTAIIQEYSLDKIRKENIVYYRNHERKPYQTFVEMDNPPPKQSVY